MAHNVKFLSLQKSELEYEVGLRGDNPRDSVVELRKQIAKLCRGFASEDILESHLEARDDLKGAKESLLKSKTFLSKLRTTFDRNLMLRTENLLNHLYHRLARISPITTEDQNSLDELNIEFQSQSRELTKLSPTTPSTSASTDLPEDSNTKDISNSSVIKVTCDRGIGTDLHKIKYDGKSCVRAFIQKVDEFVLARNITADKVLSFAAEIFTDNALHWYRSIRDKVYSWNDVVVLLKQDFSQFDYDYRLMSEIRSRSQGETENITVYLAIMHGMFSRLSRIISEDEKLEILLHNIRPCYATILASCPEIKNIEVLRNQCRNFENFQSRLSQFREPPKVTADTLAPEFAYNYKQNTSQSRSYTNNTHYKPNTNSNYKPIQDRQNYNSTKTNNNYTYLINDATDSAVDAVSPNIKRTYCPRCRTDNHSLSHCKEPKFLICFKCGKKDVTYPSCPNCVKPPNYPNHRPSKN